MRLPDLQNSFTHGVLHTPEARLLACLEDDGPGAAARFAAYRNNTYSGLFDVLKSFYPTVVTLVSEDFFRGLAHQYIKAHPPQSAVLDEYGQHMPAFLSRYTPAASLPYLPDIARLDWAVHECENAPDDVPLKREALQVWGEGVGEQKLPLRASMRLLSSPYPLSAIWQFCQRPDATPQPVFARPAHHFAVWRCDDMSVWFEEIPAPTFAALKALMVGQPLQQALSMAATTAGIADYDASAPLVFAMAREMLRGG